MPLWLWISAKLPALGPPQFCLETTQFHTISLRSRASCAFGLTPSWSPERSRQRNNSAPQSPSPAGRSAATSRTGGCSTSGAAGGGFAPAYSTAERLLERRARPYLLL